MTKQLSRIRIKRAYDVPARGDGVRVLVSAVAPRAPQGRRPLRTMAQGPVSEYGTPPVLRTPTRTLRRVRIAISQGVAAKGGRRRDL